VYQRSIELLALALEIIGELAELQAPNINACEPGCD